MIAGHYVIPEVNFKYKIFFIIVIILSYLSYK